ALSIAAQRGHLVNTGAHQRALVGNQHDLLTLEHLYRAHQRAVAFVGNHGNHALAASTATRELFHRSALAVATYRSGKNLCTRLGNQHGDDALAFRQAHTAHAARRTTHRTHLAFLEADDLAAVGEHHHFL